MRNRCTNPLSKAKVRQSWSKYNLYNLSRIYNPAFRTRTFFQMKWTAKSLCRGYHGEQVREGQWERMFTRRLKSVVPMDPYQLALDDGSRDSAGRGSGAERERPLKATPRIPYMQMTFAPLERRLDTAIFRAMFASSARQARQFVVHGAVKVNGKKMTYPGYLLNPGDMFQVEPERVMFATGAPKAPLEKESGIHEKDAEEDVEQSEAVAESAEPEDTREPREVLRDLLAQAKSVLASSREKLGGKRKQDIRAFNKSVKRMLSRAQSSTVLSDSLEAQWLELQNQLQIQREAKDKGQSSLPSEQQPSTSASSGDNADAALSSAPNTDSTSGGAESSSSTLTHNTVTDEEYNELFAALSKMAENPVDESKPYATPWMPRDYMSAFAFIPRYLEVNPTICAAVYIRHPVARPGLSEIPTPFSEPTGASAFAWYLRRR